MYQLMPYIHQNPHAKECEKCRQPLTSHGQVKLRNEPEKHHYHWKLENKQPDMTDHYCSKCNSPRRDWINFPELTICLGLCCFQVRESAWPKENNLQDLRKSLNQQNWNQAKVNTNLDQKLATKECSVVAQNFIENGGKMNICWIRCTVCRQFHSKKLLKSRDSCAVCIALEQNSWLIEDYRTCLVSQCIKVHGMPMVQRRKKLKCNESAQNAL